MSEDTRLEGIGSALGRVASGLFIVSARHEGGNQGMLGSWIMQAAFEPPMITLALKNDRGLRDFVEGSGHFAVSILGEEDGGLMKPFFSAPEPGSDQFADLSTEALESAGGAPVLLDSHAWLACKVVDKMEAGDNLVYLAEVVEGKLLKDAEPKTHVRKSGFKY